MKEKARAAATKLRSCEEKAVAQKSHRFFIVRIRLIDAEGRPID